MRLCICLETCLSSRFMSIVLWPGMTHLMPMLSQNARCGWDAWCHSLSFETFSAVAQSCLTVWDPMDCSTPGFPIHHQFLELSPTHVHWVGDGIQPAHPLSSPSPPTFNHSQHQGLFVLKTTWDDPERWYGEGGERGVQDWELMYTRGWFMSMYGKPIQYCKVK